MTYMGLLNARAFAQNGVMTDFFVRADNNYDVALTEQDLTDYYGLSTMLGFNVHCVPETKAWRREVYQAATEKIMGCYAQGDELIAATREYGALTMLLNLRKQCPRMRVFYESHNFFINLNHLDYRPFSLSRIRTRWVERHILPKADGLICLTEHQRALYQHWFPRLPTIALPLGCLDFPEHPNPEQRRLKRRVVYIGHLYVYKGLELFFQLAEHLRAARIELHIIGGYPEEVLALQQRVTQEKLTGVLFFKSFIEPKALHEILHNDVSIGLAPLQDTFYNRYLTCPVKVLDFLAHGLPIVASELPSMRDIVREAGYFCDSQKVAEFAEKVINLLDDRDAYARASQACHKRAQELKWQYRAAHILEFSSAIKTVAPQY